MTREFKAEILILKSWDFKEKHRKMQALSPQLGLITLIQFGGQNNKKGRRKGAESFCYGLGHLYKDPRFQGWQLKDFDLIHSFQENRLDLKKFYIQTLMAESMLYSHGGGGEGEISFPLLLQSFSQLEKYQQSLELDKILIRYILELLRILGWEHFYHKCPQCGKSLESQEPLFYHIKGDFSCPHCARQNMEPLSAGTRPYMDQLQKLSWDQMQRVSLPLELQNKLKLWLMAYLENRLGRKLLSLKTGSGIL